VSPNDGKAWKKGIKLGKRKGSCGCHKRSCTIMGTGNKSPSGNPKSHTVKKRSNPRGISPARGRSKINGDGVPPLSEQKNNKKEEERRGVVGQTKKKGKRNPLSRFLRKGFLTWPAITGRLRGKGRRSQIVNKNQENKTKTGGTEEK